MVVTTMLLAADNVLRDGDRNTMSIIDLIEDIAVPSFPLFIPRLSILWIVEKEAADPDDHEGALTFYLDENELNRFPVAQHFRGKNRSRLVLTLGGYVVPHAGTLRLVARLGDQLMGEYQIPVLGLNPPVAQTTNA
jgi:hypothetical protein